MKNRTQEMSIIHKYLFLLILALVHGTAGLKELHRHKAACAVMLTPPSPSRLAKGSLRAKQRVGTTCAERGRIRRSNEYFPIIKKRDWSNPVSVF